MDMVGRTGLWSIEYYMCCKHTNDAGYGLIEQCRGHSISLGAQLKRLFIRDCETIWMGWH